MKRNHTPFWRSFYFILLVSSLSPSAAVAIPSSKITTHPLSPLLRCHVTYAGSTQEIDSFLSEDPYQATLHNIADRFHFKAVMIGNAQQINYIKLYAYLQSTNKDFPIHQATFLPPFKFSKIAKPLTPINALFAGEVERELQYQCTLQGIKK